MRHRIIIVFPLVFFSLLAGCAPKGPDITRYGLADAVISRDLADLPQDLMVYAAQAGPRVKLLSADDQMGQDARFDANFFAAWDDAMTHLPKDAAFEGAKNLSPAKGFAENLRPWDTARWEELIANCRMDAYGSYPVKPAITVDTAHVRRLPTLSPYFLDPAQAGEGFPFDYLQNSTLWIGTPVSVMHTSFDGRWALVQTRLFSGWVEAEKIAVADKKFISAWKARPLGAIVRDNTLLAVNPAKKDAVSGTLVREAFIGTVLPLAPEARETPPPQSPMVWVRVPLRGADGAAVTANALVALPAVRKKPVPLTVENVALVGNAMMGQPYGWGGMFGHRDCSALMRDLLTPFGVWLPRNSGPQGRAGTRLSLEGMTPEGKEALIMEKGVPFFSLVSLPGHVGLYLGSYSAGGKEVPVMFHSIWGLRTVTGRGENEKSGRAVIGKSVVTTLRPGAEHGSIASPASILDRISGIVLLPPN